MCTEDTGWWDAEGTFFLSYPVLTDVWDWQFEAIFFFPSEIWGFWCTTIARNQQSSPRSGLQSAFSCFFSLSVMLWKSFPSFLAEGDPDEIRLFWFCILVSSEEMYIPSGFLDMVNIEVFWELLPVGSSCLSVSSAFHHPAHSARHPHAVLPYYLASFNTPEAWSSIHSNNLLHYLGTDDSNQEIVMGQRRYQALRSVKALQEVVVD